MLAAACGFSPPGHPLSQASTPVIGATAVNSAPGASGRTISALDKSWAAQALLVLDTVDSGVRDYHTATQYPIGSIQRQQLSQSAYAKFQQAVAAHQSLLPMSRQVTDTQDRDQYMFILGNIGGFLTPTPDLPADPPTLGDRIGRSLDNAIAASAAVRPRLERLANS
jgi:hypothetical protein